MTTQQNSNCKIYLVLRKYSRVLPSTCLTFFRLLFLFKRPHSTDFPNYRQCSCHTVTDEVYTLKTLSAFKNRQYRVLPNLKFKSKFLFSEFVTMMTSKWASYCHHLKPLNLFKMFRKNTIAMRHSIIVAQTRRCCG